MVLQKSPVSLQVKPTPSAFSTIGAYVTKFAWAREADAGTTAGPTRLPAADATAASAASLCVPERSSQMFYLLLFLFVMAAIFL